MRGEPDDAQVVDVEVHAGPEERVCHLVDAAGHDFLRPRRFFNADTQVKRALLTGLGETGVSEYMIKQCGRIASSRKTIVSGYSPTPPWALVAASI